MTRVGQGSNTRLTAPAPGWTAATDVVVVGSGVAGLTTALRLRAGGLKVLVVTKAMLDDGSTRWAQGGIAAARLVHPGDLVILIAYAQLTDAEARTYQPKVVFVDGDNRVTHLGGDAGYAPPGGELRSGRTDSRAIPGQAYGDVDGAAHSTAPMYARSEA